MVTYGNMIEFVLKHRGNSKAFYGYTKEQVFETLRDSARVGGLCYTTEQQELTGVITALPDCTTRQLRITNILTRNRLSIRVMVSEFRTRFPGFTLTANRKGKEVIYYNTPRLCRLLTLTSP